MDRGAWRAPVHGVTKGWTERLSLSLSVYCCASTVVSTSLETTGPKDTGSLVY